MRSAKPVFVLTFRSIDFSLQANVQRSPAHAAGLVRSLGVFSSGEERLQTVRFPTPPFQRVSRVADPILQVR